MDTTKIADEVNQDRRRFFGTAAMAVAATQLGMISPAGSTTRGGKIAYGAAPLAHPRAGTTTSKKNLP